MVFRRLMRHPFEPMATCEPRLLAWKTAFLIAIISARRVSELVALRCTTLYLVFLPHSVWLQPNIRFLPKIVSELHITSDIILLDFYPSPTSEEGHLLHTLDVKRALLFYIDRTKFPNRAQNLLVSYSGWHRGQPISSQRLSRWLTATIELAYSLEQLPNPQCLMAHST